MVSVTKPKETPMTAWRLVICRGQFCNMDRRGDKNLAAVEEALAARSDHEAVYVKVTTANCLSMCGAGPNAVLYPGNRAFNPGLLVRREPGQHVVGQIPPGIPSTDAHAQPRVIARPQRQEPETRRRILQGCGRTVESCSS